MLTLPYSGCEVNIDFFLYSHFTFSKYEGNVNVLKCLSKKQPLQRRNLVSRAIYLPSFLHKAACHLPISVVTTEVLEKQRQEAAGSNGHKPWEGLLENTNSAAPSHGLAGHCLRPVLPLIRRPVEPVRAQAGDFWEGTAGSLISRQRDSIPETWPARQCA